MIERVRHLARHILLTSELILQTRGNKFLELNSRANGAVVSCYFNGLVINKMGAYAGGNQFVYAHGQGHYPIHHHLGRVVVAVEKGEFVPEIDAPGIDDYRRNLVAVFGGAHVNSIPHEEIIAKLDRSAEVFRVLIIKTDMTIPYTSVFFELDCGYWNAAAEQRLREAIAESDLR